MGRVTERSGKAGDIESTEVREEGARKLSLKKGKCSQDAVTRG